MELLDGLRKRSDAVAGARALREAALANEQGEALAAAVSRLA